MSAGKKLINGGGGREGPNKVQGLEKNKKINKWWEGRGARLFGTSE